MKSPSFTTYASIVKRSIRSLFSLLFVAMILLNAVVGTVSAAPSNAPLMAVSYSQLAQLTTTEGGSNAKFGAALAIQGDIAVVGVPNASVTYNGQGAVYVYYRDQGGTDKWGLVRKLVASNGESGDHFGYSVAISGDTIAVGAKDATKQSDSKATWAGAVYIFRRNYPTTDAWGQSQIINATDGQKSDRLGTSVALSGNVLLAGAPFEDPTSTNAGSVYVFSRSTVDGQYTQVGKLSATQNNDKYGNAIAMDATTLVVGAPNSRVNGLTSQGMAYIYSYLKDAYGVYQFNKVATVTSSPAAANDYFGTSVAISNNILAIGSPNIGTSASGGAVYLYSKNQSGVWSLVKREVANPNNGGNLFGTSVAIDGDLLAVGAPGEDANGKADSGAIYMFARNQDTLNSWNQSGPVTITGAASNDAFGTTTGLSGATLLGGMPYKTITVNGQGAVYVLKMSFPIEIDLNGPTASSIDYYSTYTEDTGAVHITNSSTAAISSTTSSPMDKMIVTIDNLRDPGFEILAAGTATGIAAGDITYNAATGTLTIDPPGTVALSSFNTVLRSVTYINTSQNPDPIQRVVRFWVSDGVNSNLQQPGGYVTIQPVNDPPAITAQTPFSTNEDTNYDFTGKLSLTDPDSGINFIQVTLSVNRGALTLGSLAGLTFTSGDGSADSSMTFTAALVDANAALQHLIYTPVPDDFGTASLSVNVNDQGNSGSGGALNASGTYPLIINPVNDGPSLTVPGAQTTAEDTPFTFSSTDFSVSDIDAGTSPLRVTLSSSSGTMTLNTGSGVTVVQASPDLIFTGTIAQVNAALNGSTFIPAPNFSGQATLSFLVSDQGATGVPGALTVTQSVSINVTSVNDAPTLNLPGPLSTDEDTPTALGLITVSDVDAGSAPIQVTLSANHGKIAPVNAQTLTFNDSLAAVNEMLTGLSFVPDPNYAGSTTIGVTVNDNGASGSGGAQTASGAIAISVAGVNDGPKLTLPGSQTVNQDGRLILNGPIQIADPDANQVQVTLSVQKGLLTLPVITGLVFAPGSDGTDDSSMTFTGLLAGVNAALAQVVYTPTPDYSGTDTLSVAVDDLGNTGKGGPLGDSGSVNISVIFVDNAPEVSAPVSMSTSEDSTLTVGSTITISSPDPKSNAFQLTLSVAHGSLASGAASGASITSSGTLSAMNALLSGLVYTPDPNFYGGDVLAITVVDQNHAGAQTTAEVALTVQPVNDGPSVTVPGEQPVNEDTPLTFSSANGNAVLAVDIDSGASPIEITLQAVHGKVTLSNTGNLLSVTGDETSNVTFQAALADANAALNGLVFLPDPDYYGPASLTVNVNDLGNTGTPGPFEASETISINVAAVNDAPILTVPSQKSVAEDTAVALSGLLVTDVDAGSSNVHAAITAMHGLLSNGSATLEFTGSLDALNTLLSALTFTPDDNYNGTAVVSIVIDDMGDTTSGGPKTASGSITVNVTAVNDPPVVTLPESIATSEDTPLALAGISVDDVDAGDGSLKVAVSAANGALDATGSSQVTFTGTLMEVNAALGGLTYTPAHDFNGADTLTVSVDDQGNTGSGGAQTTTSNRTIAVAPINDAPTLDIPGIQTIDENQLLVFSDTRGNAIHAADVDAGADPIEVTLKAENGILKLSAAADLLSVTGDGTGTLIFQGTLASVNQALEGLSYQPAAHYYGTAKVTISVDDLGHNGDGITPPAAGEIAITINKVNNPPVAIQPAAFEVREDAGLGDAVVEFTATDPDASEHFTFTLLSGDGCDANAPFALQGSTLVTTALLDYETTTGYTLCVEVKDHEGESFNQQVQVSVLNINEAPVLHLPDVLATDEDTPAAIQGLSVSDVDAGGSDMVVFLDAAHGSISFKNMPSIAVNIDPATLSMYVFGTQAEINNEFATNVLLYSPNRDYNGPDTLTVTTSDGGATGLGGEQVDSGTVAITVNPVNDAPVNHLPGALSVDEDTPLTITGLSVTDVDAGQNPLKVDLAVTQGTLALVDASGVTVTSGGPGAMTLTAGQDALNAALAKGLAYTPAANYNGPETLSITSSDQGAEGAGGALSDTGTLAITVRPVKDPVSVTITGVNPDPGRVNQPFTIYYAVTSPAGKPGGSVTISVDGSSAACTGSIDIDGKGNCSLTLDKDAAYTLTATYGGDPEFLTGQSAPHTHKVMLHQTFLAIVRK